MTDNTSVPQVPVSNPDSLKFARELSMDEIRSKFAENRRLAREDQEKAEEERRFSIGVHDGQSCESCRFWHGKRYGEKWAASWCLRRAPVYERQYFAAESPNAQDPSNKTFPHTLYDDWCGDFEARRA